MWTNNDRCMAPTMMWTNGAMDAPSSQVEFAATLHGYATSRTAPESGRCRDAVAPRRRRRAITPSTRVAAFMQLSSRSPTQARRALEREHNRYVAMVVASDIVDDALEWMLEGWHFGERESRYSVAGYVPSLKADGFVRAGSDQVLAQADAEDRAAKRSNEQRDEAVVRKSTNEGGKNRKKCAIQTRHGESREGWERPRKTPGFHGNNPEIRVILYHSDVLPSDVAREAGTRHLRGHARCDHVNR